MSILKAPTLATILVATSACSISDCANAPLASVQSSDGKHAAVLFERNCGATTAASIHLAIVPVGEMPNGKGNALTFSKMTADIRSYQLHWSDGGHVHVSLPKGTEIYFRKRNVGAATIEVVRGS